MFLDVRKFGVCFRIDYYDYYDYFHIVYIPQNDRKMFKKILEAVRNDVLISS